MSQTESSAQPGAALVLRHSAADSIREGMSMPRAWRVNCVVALTVAVAAAAIILSSQTLRLGTEQVIDAGMLAALVAISRLFPFHIGLKRKMSMDSAPAFAAALLLPPAAAAITGAIGVGIAEAIHLKRTGAPRAALVQVPFNASQTVLALLVGSAAYQALTDQPFASIDGPLLLGASLAAAAYWVTNDLVLLAVVVAQVGRRVVRDWLFDRPDAPWEAALLASSAVVALAANSYPGIVPILVFPVAVLHRATSNQVALRLQTTQAVIALADVVDARDRYTFEHSKRVAEYCEHICAQLDLSPRLAEEIVLAARVHDVGKVGVRDAVLLKPGRLSAAEYDEIKEHPDIGARLTSRFPDFRGGTAYVRHHHERWDGGGYPAGLQGTDIPFGARVIAVADTYDAMTSNRVYRDSMGDDRARAEMGRVAGSQLDPAVVEAFFRWKGWVAEPVEWQEPPAVAA